MLKSLPVLLIILSLCACSMPETQIYSLNMSDNISPSVSGGKGNPGEGKSDIFVAVLVDSPRYLSQPYIATRTSPYRLVISRYSKWDTPPDETVRQAFRDRLAYSGLFGSVRASNIVPEGYYSLKIYLARFDGVDEGDSSFGELSFTFSLLSPEGKEIYLGAFKRKVKLEGRGFVDLARALSGALTEGTEEAGTNVEKFLKLK